MRLRPPSCTRTDTHFPDTALFRSDAVLRRCQVVVSGDLDLHDPAIGVDELAPGVAVSWVSGVGRHAGAAKINRRRQGGRSEEHTSELQSLMRISSAVFGLKKKIKQQVDLLDRDIKSMCLSNM